MAKKGVLPPDIVNAWPEIFKDIKIDVKKSKTKPDLNIETALDDLFNQYEKSITNVDFRLDTAKVKRDIKKRTEIFMKKRK